MKFNAILIIFLVLSAVIVGVGVWKLTIVDIVDNKQVNPVVPVKCYGLSCKTDCGVLDPLTVRRCENTPDGKKKCTDECKCDSSGKLSGCMDCQDTDPDDPKTVIRNNSIKSKTLCIDPFFWDDNEGTCKLTKGSYCLPAHVDDITCNPYTGNKALTLDNKTNTYSWSCVCKDDLKFSGNTCSDINVCGLEGESQNPNNTLRRGLLKDGSADNYWNSNSDWDPLKAGNSKCSCRSNEVADNNRLLCLPNSCSPGSQNPDDPGQSCKCDPDQGLVDCYEISTSYDGIAPYYNGSCKFPSCVPDPCAGDGKDGFIHGQYTTKKDKTGIITGGYCQCRKGDPNNPKYPNDPNDPTYFLVPDPNAYGGFSCKQLCIDNGPCGDRGKCKVQDLNKAFTQFTIRCKDMDSDGQCTSSLFMIIYSPPSPSPYPSFPKGKLAVRDSTYPSSSPSPYPSPYPSSQYYLNYYKDKGKLILEKTQNPNSFFSFKLKKCKVGDNNQPNCSDTTTSAVDKGLNSSSYYYIMIGDKYLSFNPLGDGTYKLVDENNPDKEGSLFIFLNEQGNKRPLSSVSGIMFFPQFQKYLSINPNDRSIIYDPSSKNQEYCDPCNDGYRQDPNMLCQRTCRKSGDTLEGSWLIEVPDGNTGSPPSQSDIAKVCCSGKGISKLYTKSYNQNDVIYYKYKYDITCS